MSVRQHVVFLCVLGLIFGCDSSDGNELETAGSTAPPSSGASVAGQVTIPPSSGGAIDMGGNAPKGGLNVPMAGSDSVGGRMMGGMMTPKAGEPGMGGAMQAAGLANAAGASAGTMAGGAPIGGQGVGGMVFGGELVGGVSSGGEIVGGMPTAGMPEVGGHQMAGQPAMVRRVDFCRYQGPTGDNVNPGIAFDVYGLVYEAGITDRTDGTDIDPSLWAEGGYGPRGSNPAGNDVWSWQRAIANPAWNAAERNEPNNDEYMATLRIPLMGDYDLAYRFTLDGGQSWTYCDRGMGSVDGYSPEQAGLVSVVRAEKGDYCRIQFPEAHTGQPGDRLNVYGNVYEEGITDRSPQVDPDENLVVEAGYGPRQTDPDGNRSWNWVRGAGTPNWNGAERGEPNNDEYVAQLTLPTTGEYDMAVRFSVDGGQNWLYCDTGDGSTDGYSTADAARLTTGCADGLREACGRCLAQNEHCLDLVEGNQLIGIPLALDGGDNSIGALFADQRITRVAGGYFEAVRDVDGVWVGSLADPQNGGIRSDRAYWVTTTAPIALILNGVLKVDEMYMLSTQPEGLRRCPDGFMCVDDVCIAPDGDAGGQAAGAGAMAMGGAVAMAADEHMAGGHQAPDGPRARACNTLLNWVSFPGSESRRIEDAIPEDVQPRIVSVTGQGQVALRQADGGFVGNLESLEPMKGYLIEVSADVNFQFRLAD